MSKRERNWKPSLLAVEDIEYDLRIGQTKFYQWVAQGWMPQPYIKDRGMVRWRTAEIEECLARFPDRAAFDAEIEEQSAKFGDAEKRSSPWINQRVG